MELYWLQILTLFPFLFSFHDYIKSKKGGKWSFQVNLREHSMLLALFSWVPKLSKQVTRIGSSPLTKDLTGHSTCTPGPLCVGLWHEDCGP